MSWGQLSFPVGLQPAADFSAGDPSLPAVGEASRFLARFLDAVAAESAEAGSLSAALRHSPHASLSALLADMPSEYRDRLQDRLGPALTLELTQLARESDPELLWEQALHLARRLERVDRLEPALALLQGISQEAGASFSELRLRADRAAEAILGQGAGGARFEFLLRRFAREATDPWMIAGFGAGSLAFKATKLGFLSRLSGGVVQGGVVERAALGLLASAAGLGAEVPVFVLVSKGGREIVGTAQDWSASALAHELASTGLTLFCLKSTGALSRKAAQGWSGLDAGLAQAVPRVGLFSGIVLARKAEEALGWRAIPDGATLFVDSLSTYFQLSVGGRLADRAFGARFRALQGEWDLRAARFVRERTPSTAFFSALPVFATTGSMKWRGPSLLEPPNLLMMSGERDGDGGGRRPPSVSHLRLVEPKRAPDSRPAGAKPEESATEAGEPRQQVVDLSARRMLKSRGMDEKEREFREKVDEVVFSPASERWQRSLETEVLERLSPERRTELGQRLEGLHPDLVAVFGRAAAEYPWQILAKVFSEMELVRFSPGEVDEVPLPKPFNERLRDSLSHQLPLDYKDLFRSHIAATSSQIAEGMSRVSDASVTLLGHWTQDPLTRLLMAQRLGLPGLPVEKAILDAYRLWEATPPDSE